MIDAQQLGIFATNTQNATFTTMCNSGSGFVVVKSIAVTNYSNVPGRWAISAGPDAQLANRVFENHDMLQYSATTFKLSLVLNPGESLWFHTNRNPSYYDFASWQCGVWGVRLSP